MSNKATRGEATASEKLRPFLGTALSGEVAALVACLFMASIANGSNEAPEMEHTAALPMLTEQAEQPAPEEVLPPEFVEEMEAQVPKAYTQPVAPMPTPEAETIPELLTAPLPEPSPMSTPSFTPVSTNPPSGEETPRPEPATTYQSTPGPTTTATATPTPTPTPTVWTGF